MAFTDLDLAVFTSTLVRSGAPILLVFHDAEGDWQFLASTEQYANELLLAHIAHLLESDVTLHAVADLPVGWKAWRWTMGDAWVREPIPADQEHVES